MNNILKKITEPTYIYALLVFIGYYNYFTFYTFFGVNIIDYLTLSELVMSFLNLTIPIMVLLVVVLVFFILGMIKVAFSKEEEIKRYQENTYRDNFAVFKGSLRNIKDIFKEKKWTSVSTYLWLLLFIFQFLMSIVIFLFIIVYPFDFYSRIVNGNGLYGDNIVLVLILGFIWIMLLDDVFGKVFKQIEMRRVVQNSIIFLFFIGFLTIINRIRAKNILNGKHMENIEFTYQGENIKTGSVLIYFGQTDKFIFLKDLEKNENIIYQREKIDLIKYTKK